MGRSINKEIGIYLCSELFVRQAYVLDKESSERE